MLGILCQIDGHKGFYYILGRFKGIKEAAIEDNSI
jgi:hypothetical protein